MSLEILILLALFTLLPIIEQAWRKHREARERARRRALGLPPVPLPPPIPRVPAGHAPLPTRTDALEDDEDDDVAAVVVPPAPRPRPAPVPRPIVPTPFMPRLVALPRTLAPPARRQGSRLRDIARDRGAVRRGIVLMTVLGPCRANAPYDTSAVGGNARDQ